MRPNLVTQLDSAQAARQQGDDRVHVSLHHLMRLRHKATGFSFLPKQPVHSILAGRHASRLRGRGLNFEEIRRYLPGDDVRTIDWHVTARMRQPHVRVYTEERDRQMLLLIDQRRHMFFGSCDRMKSVCAAEVAALGAWRGLDSGDRVGAIVFGDDGMDSLRPRSGKQAVMQLLSTVVRRNQLLSTGVSGAGAEGQFNAALEHATRVAAHDALVVIVSDFLGADQQSEELVMRLAAHNDVLGVLVHDPLRETPPENGRGVVTDGEQQVEVDFGDRRFVQGLKQDYVQERSDIATFLRKLSAPLLCISTKSDPAEQIRELLGGRR